MKQRHLTSCAKAGGQHLSFTNKHPTKWVGGRGDFKENVHEKKRRTLEILVNVVVNVKQVPVHAKFTVQFWYKLSL
jgi:hypothetical protein